MQAKMTFDERLIGPNFMVERAIAIEEVCGTMNTYMFKLSKNIFSGPRALASVRSTFYSFRG